MIQNGYNSFTLQEGTSTAIITLTPGNYNRKTFASAVQSLLRTTSPNGWSYTITYPTEAPPVAPGTY